MTLSDFAKKILKTNHLIPRKDWPTQISLPSETSGGILGFGAKNKFWEQILNLRSFTDSGSENFSDHHTGSTGWEYLLNVVFIDGKFVYTNPTSSRDYSSVSTTASTLRVETKQIPKTLSVIDKFLLDDRHILSMTYTGEKEITLRNERLEKGELHYGFLTHFHSHPRVILGGMNRPVYSFYSRTDLNTLFSGNMQMQGLVTDRLWLLGKTKEGILPSQRDLQEVSKLEITNPEQFIQAASDLISRSEMVLYLGNFGDLKLQRIA